MRCPAFASPLAWCRVYWLVEMFPFCILYDKELQIKNMGAALRACIPQMVGRKVTEFWELIKPLVDFKYEVIETRMNSMFELATQDEIDKLRTATGISVLQPNTDVGKHFHEVKNWILLSTDYKIYLFKHW